MRLLIFSHIPISIHSLRTTNSYFGGNWISEFLDNIKKIQNINIGVCFHSNEKHNRKIEIDNITYYLIGDNRNILTKIIDKINHKLIEEIESYLNIVKDFKPTIVHVFGTEYGFALITPHIKEPVIIHIQGLLNPIIESYFPQRISEYLLKRAVTTKERFFRNGAFHRFKDLEKRAKREIKILTVNNNYFIRNQWSKNYISTININSRFFFCQEIIRKSFYDESWEIKERPNSVFVSLFNGEPYKGWDNILRIAHILKRFHSINFKWQIIGVSNTEPLIRLFEDTYNIKYNEVNVEFIGKKANDDLVKTLLEADLFVHLSHIDNSPNSVAEAMLLGMPVICNDVGGCSELIENRITGILLKDNDPYTAGYAIVSLINDPEAISRISKNARSISLKRHNRTDILNTTIDVYQQLERNS